MGPLNGFKIIELAGIGPGPFWHDAGRYGWCSCRAYLQLRPRRAEGCTGRNRRSIAVDLKSLVSDCVVVGATV